MKKSIPIIRERESEAFILGNGREREFSLTPESKGIILEEELCFLLISQENMFRKDILLFSEAEVA